MQLSWAISPRATATKSPQRWKHKPPTWATPSYMCHDIDDGIRSGLVSPRDFEDVELFGRCWREVQSRLSGQPEALQVQETLRDAVGLMIRGTIAHSLQNIERYGIKTLADVRNSPEVILLPDGLAQQHAQLKSQMYKKLYHHQEVSLVRKDVEQVIGGLFQVYMENPHLLPAGPLARRVCNPTTRTPKKPVSFATTLPV